MQHRKGKSSRGAGANGMGKLKAGLCKQSGRRATRRLPKGIIALSRATSGKLQWKRLSGERNVGAVATGSSREGSSHRRGKRELRKKSSLNKAPPIVKERVPETFGTVRLNDHDKDILLGGRKEKEVGKRMVAGNLT